MKIHYLLLTLAAGALGIVAIEPWQLNSLPTQLTQSARVADNSSRQVNPQAAQAVANKVTVQIEVGEGFGSGVLLGKTVGSSGNMAELDREAQSATAEIEDSKGDGKKAKIWAYMNSGGEKYALKDYKGAIADSDLVIAIDPQNSSAYLYRGNAKSSLWYEKDAIADYDRAIAIDPRYGVAYLSRGGTKDLLGDYEGAIADYDRAAAIHHSAKSAREQHKSRLKQYRSTVAKYDREISLQERAANASNPQDGMAYLFRGNAKANLRNYKGAIADYDRAIAIDPQNSLAYFSRGEAKHSLGDRQGGIADMNTMVQLSKGSDDKLFLPVAKNLVQQGFD